MTDLNDGQKPGLSAVPYRVWGHQRTMQAMLMSAEGLVIRNGEQRVLIPREHVHRFRGQLDLLLNEAPAFP